MHTSTRQMTTMAVALGAFAATAHAEFVASGVVSLQSWTDAANATQLDEIMGGPVRVYRYYAAFDSNTSADRVLSVSNAQFFPDGQIVNLENGLPIGEGFGDPEWLWDSYVTINASALLEGLAPLDGSQGIDIQPCAIFGGWSTPSADQGTPGTLAGADDFGTGLFLVMLAQVTVVDNGSLTGDIVDIGFFGSNVLLSELSIQLASGTKVDITGPSIFGMVRDPDLNQDFVVDGGDLAYLLANWGPCESSPCPCPGDVILDESMTVDGSDLAWLLTNWSD